MGFLEGFVEGFVKEYSRSKGGLERLLAQAGMTVAGRKGDALKVELPCPTEGKRPIFISPAGECVAFATFSDAIFDSRKVPDVAMAFALAANEDSPFSKWHISLEGDEAAFWLAYATLGAGLTARMVREVCDKMVEMAAQFDVRMRQERLA
ncbi:MAG TPA: hypothetical protein VG826_18720 [Pirellulales bacterium]|nr:hypothetical protein [Pirellulales bacterium]